VSAVPRLPGSATAIAIAGAVLVCLASSPVGATQSAQAPPRDARTAPAAPQGPGAIAGLIVDAATGQPLPGARVILTGADSPMTRGATTDPQGRFEITGLPAGRYTLSAMRVGFVESSYGQKRPGSGRPGTPIQVTDGQRIGNVTLPLPRGGVITGMVMDEFGFPAAGTAVRVYRSVFRNGERALQQAGTAQADDRGIYRIFGLQPADYVVVATPRSSPDVASVMDARKAAELELVMRAEAAKEVFVERLVGNVKTLGAAPTEGYVPVYYPGTPVASMAARLTLDVSEEKAGIDFALQVVPFSRIAGMVTGVSPPPPSLTVYLTETGPVSGLGTKTARVGPDGRFALSSVPPGQYQLTVRAALRASVPAAYFAPSAGQPPAARIEAQPSQWMWAQMDVAVNGQQDSDVVLTLAPGLSVSGSVTFRGSSPPPDPSRVRLSLLPIGSSPAAAEMELATGSARVDAQGRFTAVGLIPGRYRVMASGVQGWSLASVTAQGREALDFPIEIKSGEDVTGVAAVFSDRAAALSGTLQNADGGPTADFTVVLFPDDARYWTPLSRRIAAVRPSTDGRFSLGNLPAGDYRLAAVVDPEPGQWFDPEFLRQLLAGSTRITLAEGESRTQDIRVR
jgi:hypothetical protein